MGLSKSEETFSPGQNSHLVRWSSDWRCRCVIELSMLNFLYDLDDWSGGLGLYFPGFLGGASLAHHAHELVHCEAGHCERFFRPLGLIRCCC